MISVYVVVPVFNNWSQAQACLDALADSTYENVKIVIVDHGTIHISPEALAGHVNVIHLLASPEVWWAEATNIGIRAALADGADYVMLLNDDCHVVPDTISKLIAHTATHARNAIYAPVLRDSVTNTLETNTATTCFLLGFPTLPLPHRLRSHVGKDITIETALIMGGRGALIPAQVFTQVGLLESTTLPHYGADHDFYLRCRKWGVPLYITANAVVIVNNQRTTQATNIGALPLDAFLATFRNRRSHKNLQDLAALFKRHYPIPGLYPLGVILNVSRYTLLYCLKRTAYLIRNKFWNRL